MVCDWQENIHITEKTVSLNPYSIGIWSATEVITALQFSEHSLNPYSIGIWSATF